MKLQLLCLVFTIMAAAFATGVAYLRSFDRATRVLILLIAQTLVAEITAMLLDHRYHTNLVLYAINTPVELLLICLYFNYSIPGFRARHTGWYLGAAGILLAVLNTICLQPLGTYNSNFVLIEGAAAVMPAMYALYCMLLLDNDVSPTKDIHFWLTSSILLYWGSSFTIQALQNVPGRMSPAQRSLLAILIFTLSLLYYGSQGILFFSFRKTAFRG